MSDTGTQYTLDIAQAEAALDRLGLADTQLRASINATTTAANAGFAEAAKSALAYSDRLAAANNELRAAQAATREVQAAVNALTAANRDLTEARKASTSTAEYNRLTKLIADNNAEIKKARAIIQENKIATDQERASVQAVVEARRQETNQVRLQQAATKDLTAQIKAETAAQREAGAAAKQSASESSGGASGGFFGGLLSKLPGIGAGLFSVSAIIDTVKQKLSKGLDDYAALSGIQNTFKAIAGSASEGAREYTFVKQRANELGLELTSTASAYTGLYAAAKESNFSIATTRDLYVGLTAAGKTLDRSQEQIRSSLVAVEQMISKGTVSSQELKLQLGNALPGAFGLAAKAAGLTTEAFTKQLAQGKILANDFLPKFAAVLKDKYVNSTQDAAAGVRSNLGRINNAFQESSAKIGAFLAPAVKYVADFVGSTKKASEATAEEQLSLAQSFEAITSLNVGNSERTRLIKELQAEYPAFLGNINAEKVSNEELSGAIDKVNESLVNRILLQKEDEKISEQAAKTAKIKTQQLAAEREINKQLGALDLERQKNVTSSNGIRAIEENGSVGFGVDLKKDNAGLSPLAKGENTLDLIANRKVAISTLSPAYEKLSVAVQAYKKATVALNDEEDKGNELTREKAAFMQLLGISTAASTGALNGNAAALTKSIDALQAHRKEISDQMQALKTNDYNDAPYRAKLAALKADIDKTDKLIAELEGKQDKSALSKENKAKALLAAYLRELQTYRELALKAAEAQAEDAKVASERQFQLDLTNIYEASRKLKAAKKAAGQGGELDSVQTEQESTLLQGAYKAHYDRLLGIRRTYQDNLISLETDGDKQELDALDTKFARELEKYAKQPELLKQAQEKYDKERRDLLNKQANAKIDQGEAAATADAVGEIQGLKIKDPVAAERAKQEALLAVQIEYAGKRLKLAEALDAVEGTDKTHAAVQGLRNTITQLGNQVRELKEGDKKFDIYKFIFGKYNSPDLRKALDEVTASVVASFSQMLAAQQQAAAARAADATTAISELQGQIQTQLGLRAEGSASSVGILVAEQQKQREIRKSAIEEQRRAAKEQVIIDTLTQASNIVTAASEVFKAFAVIPYVGVPLGIAAAGALVGAFIASKASAYEAAGKIGGSGYFKGGPTGGDSIHEERGVVHGKEFVFDNEKTSKYQTPLFDALHAGRPEDIDWQAPQMRALLPTPNLWDTPQMRSLMPDLTLPARMREERAASIQQHFHLSQEPLRNELARVSAKLEAIEGHVARSADRKDLVPLGSNRYMERDPSTQSTRVVTLQ